MLLLCTVTSDDLKAWGFLVTALVTLSILSLNGLADIRDKLVDQGFIKESWYLGKQSIESRKRNLQRTLRLIGYTGDHIASLRTGFEVTADRTAPSQEPIEVQLLRALKHHTKHLAAEGTYRGTGKYYIDTMGAVCGPAKESERACEELSGIFERWVRLLIKNSISPRPDLILCNKVGNPLLIQSVGSLLSAGAEIPLISVKAAGDKSRINTAGPGRAHITEFEGLANSVLFLTGKRDLDSRKLPVILLDDNCRGGSTLISIAKRFNNLLRSNPELPFEPVRHAVVLFTIESDDTYTDFRNNDLTLHSLLHFDEDLVARLYNEDIKNLIKSVAVFQKGFSCESIKTVRRGGVIAT